MMGIPVITARRPHTDPTSSRKTLKVDDIALYYIKRYSVCPAV